MNSSSSDISLPCPPPPLHVAVWEGDINRIRDLLNSVCPEGEESRDPVQAENLKNLLELKDNRGNSALPWPYASNCEGWSCAHDAALCDDEFLLAQMYLRGEKQLIQSLESSQETFVQALEKLPDFEAELFIEAQSWVPIVSSVLPSDTIRIWKRGTQLRIDSTLKGLDGVKWKKGTMSHIYLGRENRERAGHAVVMDHENKKFYDVLEAMHNSSVGNMDLALHVSLTTAMSSSSLNATNLEFVKQKTVKAEAKTDERRIDQDAEKKSSRSRQRRCPWAGTTYKMQNFSIEAQFRPVVNPDRKLKHLPTNNDKPFEEVQQFVKHLQSCVPHGKDQKNVKVKRKHRFKGNSTDEKLPQTLQLEKGRKIEMHLDVIAGDTIQWEFLSKSSDYCFEATYFHDDKQLPVCHTDGVKNMKIVGAFEIEHNGSFVLMWQNTQAGFVFDRNGIKITYSVAHVRSAVGEPPVDTPIAADLTTQGDVVSSNSSMSQADTKKMSNGSSRLTDEQKCEIFRQLNHIPNPMTTTTAFVDYFRLGEVSSESKESQNDKYCESKRKKSSFSKIFEDKKQHHPQPSTASSLRDTGADTAFGMKNTFRSLTLVPATRHVRKDIEAKVIMSESFPFQLQDFLPVIKFVSTTGDHVKNLEEFFQMKLPPGYPLFEIPNTYREVFTLDEVRS
ncbi:unnamed protein product [Peronospora farinosa]|uniref:Ankyrin repeat domain-containing protein n=1 Tax=Peronospora farinosa TaxID=134698 RepID=A0AAV0TYV8_9STRA|nr:unnamed protein product [Peronospora farinosa]